MRSDSILEESWVYQELKQEFLGKGREEERQKELERQRQTLISYVEMRFPGIVALAKQQADTIKDPEVLQNVILKMFAVQTAEEAEQYLLTVNKEDATPTATLATPGTPRRKRVKKS